MTKTIIASGPVIIENGKLLVNKDNKDDFYKLPGGTIEEGIENLEEACHREVKEENNAEIEIIKPLHPMILWKNPQTKEAMTILLIHYLAKLKNPKSIKPMPPIKEVKWLDINEIKSGKHKVAPNIKFLIEKGDIK
jgi:ADP-ribose pyrophosphatase YjhB (NUDIX family)